VGDPHPDAQALRSSYHGSDSRRFPDTRRNDQRILRIAPVYIGQFFAVGGMLPLDGSRRIPGRSLRLSITDVLPSGVSSPSGRY